MNPVPRVVHRHRDFSTEGEMSETVKLIALIVAGLVWAVVLAAWVSAVLVVALESI